MRIFCPINLYFLGTAILALWFLESQNVNSIPQNDPLAASTPATVCPLIIKPVVLILLGTEVGNPASSTNSQLCSYLDGYRIDYRLEEAGRINCLKYALRGSHYASLLGVGIFMEFN